MNRYYVRLLFRIVLVLVLGFLWWYEPYANRTSMIGQAGIRIVEFLLFVVGLNLTLSLSLLIYRRRKKMGLTEENNLTFGAENIYGIIITFTFIAFLLSLWGIDFKTLFTSLSIVAAAIAIVSKDFVSPVIGGLIVAISRDLSIGDMVRIGDHRGKIVDLSLTKIALLNEDNDRIYIPNDKAYLSEIVNYSRGDLHRISIPFELDPSSVGTVEDLEANLIKALIPYSGEIVQDSFTLRIVEIRKDSIALKFQYTLDRIDSDLEKEIKRRTVRRVLNYITNRSTIGRERQIEEDGI